MSENEKGTFRAYNVAEALRLKGVDKILDGNAIVRSAAKLIYQIGENSYFFIYRFGSVVFFNVEDAKQKDILKSINNFVGDVPDILTSEDFLVELKPDEKNSVGFEAAILKSLALEQLDILAWVLAQSTALEYFEIKVDEMFREIKKMGIGLRDRGRLRRSSKSIKKFIGNCITTKENLVSTLYLLDKPDETWEDQVLDRLYREGREMFEIRDRYKTLDYKLKMIQENLELIADLLQHRNANWLEATIIILILVEIVWFFFEYKMKGG